MADRGKLLLLRHGLAEAQIPDKQDHDRALTKSGLMQAKAVADYLARVELSPDLVLCSDALRVQQTIETIKDVSKIEIATPTFLPALYDASMQELESAIRRQPDNVKCLMLIAHNPGLGMLAAYLASPQAKPKSYPEATLSVYTVTAPWDMITPHYAILEDIFSPKPELLASA